MTYTTIVSGVCLKGGEVTLFKHSPDVVLAANLAAETLEGSVFQGSCYVTKVSKLTVSGEKR